MLSLAIIAFSSTVLSQGFSAIQGAPACVQSCTALSDISNKCNSAPTMLDAGYCFCTDGAISTFASNPALCSETCQDGASQAEASQWFAAFCANPATLTAPQSATATPTPAPTEASSAPPSETTPSTETVTTTPTPSDTDSDTVTVPEDESWWDAHARWVAMAIVLIVGFAIIIVVGIFWKRHHNKKRNRGDRLAPGQHWGPAQHQRHPSTENYGSPVVHDAEKGQPTVRTGVPLRQDSATRQVPRSKGIKRLLGK